MVQALVRHLMHTVLMGVRTVVVRVHLQLARERHWLPNAECESRNG
jgi:hypothetical protein